VKTTPVTHTLSAWLQWTIFAGLALVVVYLPFHAFISTWGGSAIGPLEIWKSWKEYFLVLLAIPMAIWLSLKPDRWKVLFRDPLAWWIVAFVVVLGFLGVINLDRNGTDATLAGLAMTGRYLLIFTLAYTLFKFGAWRWDELRGRITKYLIGIGIVVAVLGLIQVFVLPNDFLSQFGYDKDKTIAPYTLIDENPEAPRAFATLRGPNDYAAFLILPIILTVLAAKRSRWWLVATGILLLALFESSSRSAWLGALLAIVTLFAMTYGKAILSSRKWQLGIAGVLVAGVVVMIAAVSIPSIRLEIFHSSPGDSSLTEGSTDNHWQATARGLSRVLSDPMGCGPGCAGPASYYGDSPRISENYYVQLAEEVGVSGLILWIGVAVMVLQRLWKQRKDQLAMGLFAAFIGISLVGFWLHVWADDPLSLTWWALAGGVLGYYANSRYDDQKAKQKNHDRKTQKNPAQISR